jgi:ParB/RepB/Spo0J family partition protein
MQIREPDRTHVSLDPNTCEVMEGHQHTPAGIDDLADSIKTLGQLHPSLVIEYADGRRLIAAGRRRWMACKQRGLPLIANVWTCEGDDINLELFAKAIRVAENIERCDPSAMDVATQLQTIRNERQLPNARTLGEYMGMSESRVKKYLSLFAASDDLRSAASRNALPLAAMLELTKCEKRLGVSKTKKLLARFLAGEISTADLAKLRSKPSSPKRAKVPTAAKLRKSGTAMLKAFEAAPPETLSYLAELISQLQELMPDESSSSVESTAA